MYSPFAQKSFCHDGIYDTQMDGQTDTQTRPILLPGQLTWEVNVKNEFVYFSFRFSFFSLLFANKK